MRQASLLEAIGPVAAPPPAMLGGAVFNAPAFNQFWAAYPHRVGKGAAIKVWNKLRPGPADVETILAGIARYLVSKPAYADWCHPQTWLRQGRWADEPATVGRPPIAAPALPRTCPHCGTVGGCQSFAECRARRLAGSAAARAAS